LTVNALLIFNTYAEQGLSLIAIEKGIIVYDSIIIVRSLH